MNLTVALGIDWVGAHRGAFFYADLSSVSAGAQWAQLHSLALATGAAVGCTSF